MEEFTELPQAAALLLSVTNGMMDQIQYQEQHRQRQGAEDGALDPARACFRSAGAVPGKVDSAGADADGDFQRGKPLLEAVEPRFEQEKPVGIESTRGAAIGESLHELAASGAPTLRRSCVRSRPASRRALLCRSG